MYNFSAIYGLFKALLLNFRSNTVTYTSEITKFVISLVAGVFLVYLLLSFNEVPFRSYSITLVKLFEPNPKDLFSLKIDIGYDEKSFKPILEDYERGVTLNILPIENLSNDSMKYLEGYINMTNHYDTLVLRKSDALSRKVPFIDSVRASYYISCAEIKIPAPSHYNIDCDKDTIIEPYTVKVMSKNNVDSVFEAKRYHITTISVVEDAKFKKLVSSKLVGTTDTMSAQKIVIPASTGLTSYKLFSYHDISQSNYFIKLNLPSYKKRDGLKIDFGGATDFSPIYPTPDRIEMSSIFYDDVEKLKIIADRGLMFNAKFRELENLQMIRLFFITTLLGFLIGLFFSSIWNLSLLGIESYRKKNRRKRTVV